MTEQSPTIWSNWHGNVALAPASFSTPRDLEEVVQVVRDARDKGQQLRVVGGGHSWSSITGLDDGGALLSLDKLRGLVAVDLERKTARVLGGTRLSDLNEALAGVGLGLSNLGSIDQQSIAGVTSTATHGTGARFGNLSTQVLALTLVDAQGTVHKLSDADGDVMLAARCALGSMGVITEVTLQCEPAFNLRGLEEKWPLDKAIEALPQLVADHEHVKLWWLPHTDSAIVFRQDRTDEPAQRKPIQTWLRNHFLKNHVFRTGMAAAARVPSAVPTFNKLLAAGSAGRTEVIDRSDRVFTFPVHTPHTEMEYAFGVEHAMDAFAQMRAMIERESLHVGFIVEIRFVKGDDILLSPAHGRDSCYIGALQYKALPHERYFSGFAELMARFDGRPHWGKVHHLSAAELRGLYPRWDDFAQIRQQFDPDAALLNDETRRIFGL
jgi:FAD-linked oxidoreductase